MSEYSKELCNNCVQQLDSKSSSGYEMSAVFMYQCAPYCRVTAYVQGRYTNNEQIKNALLFNTQYSVILFYIITHF